MATTVSTLNMLKGGVLTISYGTSMMDWTNDLIYGLSTDCRD
jgi:hypothetical protein